MASDPFGLSVDGARTLAYAPTVKRDLTLLEVPEDIVAEILEHGAEIKGPTDGIAVLCTSDRTFTLKNAETNNSLMCCLPSQCGGSNENSPPELVVDYELQSYVEAINSVPRTDTLLQLLAQRPYSFEDEQNQNGMDIDAEGNTENGLYTFDDLRQCVQASSEELREALSVMNAVEVSGHWRVMDESYVASLADTVLMSCIENRWDMKKIPRRQLEEAMKMGSHEETIVHHCLSMLGSPGADDRSDGWCLDEEKVHLKIIQQCLWKMVCICLARRLLSENPRWPVQHFLAAWHDALPASLGLQPSLEMLTGEVLQEECDHGGQGRVVKAFPLRALPREPHSLFRVLFEERRHWLEEDIRPYLANMHVPANADNKKMLRDEVLLVFAKFGRPKLGGPRVLMPRKNPQTRLDV